MSAFIGFYVVFIFRYLLCFIACLCNYVHDTFPDACFSDALFLYSVLACACHLASFYHSLGSFLTFLDLHVLILELELKWILLLRIKLFL